MKTYEIAYVDVTCLNSIEEAIEHSCEIYKCYSSGNIFGINEFRYTQIPEMTAANFLNSEDEPDLTKSNFQEFTINLFPYQNKLIEYRDFYRCFTDRLMAVELALIDFNTLHELINRTDDDSKDNFPSPRLRELIGSITDTLLNSSFDYFTGLKLFTLKSEIIAFVDYPVIKPVNEGFDPYVGKAIQAWGYFLKKPSHCLRFKASK